MNGSQDERVEAALEELLSWPPIARSPQLAKFLSYIVTAKLKGEEAGIKAYAIAVDVFGRPATFDPQSDPIVRVQARRLRALLDQFYDEGNSAAGVRIHLPVGRYVPEFVSLSGAAEPAVTDDQPDSSEFPVEARPPPETPPARSIPTWLVGAVAGLVAAGVIGVVYLGVTSFLAQNPAQPAIAAPAEPRVLVGQFSNLTGMPVLDSFGPQLSEAVQKDLTPFESIHVAPDDPARSASVPLPDGTYLLSGIVHTAPSGVEVTATLTQGAGDSIWNATFSEGRPAGGADDDIVATIARSIARDLGPFRGPLHMRGRAWLDEQGRPLPAVNTYTCLLTYFLARESGSSINIADALTCTQRLLKEQPDAPLAISASAWLNTRAAVNRVLPLADVQDDVAKALADAERALTLAPNSSMVHEHLGAIKNWQSRFDASEQDYVAALQLNPLNTDARAGYAITLSRSLKWALGGEQAAIAIADTPYPSPWYYYPESVNALREGRLEEALESGRKAIRFAGGEIGTAITIVAAVSLGRKDEVDELVPRLMSMESLRRAGIMTWISAQITDPAILAQMAVALGRAGVPQAALTEAF